MRRPLIRRLVAAAACLIAASAAAPPAVAGPAYVPISGAGSTWSENALDSWAANVAQYGMKINYAGTGSSDGRNQFRNGTVDFAISEIPYGIADDGVVDPPPPRPFAYLPIVAGGTSFMYHLDSGGKRITNLRLDGTTITKIFTGGITEWNDPAIKADNPGIALPARKIIPVVRQDGSGTTAQLTTWMAATNPAIWNAYCGSTGRKVPCGTTSFYPVPSGTSAFVEATLSTGVAGYVAQDTGEGAITYVEYSYARNSGFPVLKVENADGYYTQPTQYNVAVALTRAVINPDLTQKLDGVYSYNDPRTYPLSSYSYMIVPTSTQAPFSTAKGLTLGDFVYYFLCTGQQSAGDLGYSPLPVNLVQAGFNVIRTVPGVNVQNIDITKCQNPTFTSNGTNNLANIAPQPASCDYKGATQCDTNGVTPVPAGAGGTGGTSSGTSGGSSSSGGTTGGGTSGGSSSGGTASGGSSGGGLGGATGAGTAGGGVGAATGGGGTAADTTAGGAAGPVGGATSIDPDTGKVVSAAGGGSSAGGTGGAALIANPVDVGSGISGTFQQVLMGIAVALLIAIAVGPPMLSRHLARRSGRGRS